MRLILTALIAAVVPLEAIASCDALSRYGLYDTSVSVSNQDRAMAFRSWFCQKEFSSASEAESMGTALGYGGYTLDYDENSESWSEYYFSYCRDDSFSSRDRSSTVDFVQNINEQMVRSLESCLTQKGLHAWIEQGDGYFRFRTQFNPSSAQDPLPTVQAFSVNGSAKNCRGSLRVGDSVGPDGTEILCERSDNGQVAIQFDATSFVINDTPLTLAAISPPPEPKPRLQVSIRATDFTRGGGVQEASGAESRYGSGVILNAPPYDDKRNWVEYDFRANAGGPYRLFIEYAAASSRPVVITVNGVQFRASALSGTTGCWTPNCQEWDDVGVVVLREGRNKLLIDRSSVFPHIRAIRWEPE